MENKSAHGGSAKEVGIVTKTLPDHPFFEAFKAEHLSSLQECSTTADFKPGEYLYREGTTADRLYLVLEGRVAIELTAPGHDPWLVMTVCEGGVLGWAWAFPPHRWYYSCRAVEPTRTVLFEAECLRAKMKEDCEMGYTLVMACGRVLEERLRGTRLQLLDLLTKS